MIAEIQKVEGDIDARDLVRRSPVALVPAAEEKLLNFACLSASMFIGRMDGVPACVWGFIQPSLLSQQAYMWLLTTDLVKEHPFVFIRRAQRHVEEMLKIYPLLVGDCSIKDTQARRWLRLLGAKFGDYSGDTIPFAIEAKP